jgi:hypothetical protein
MRYRNELYITLEWQEEGPLDTSGRRLQKQGRQVTAQEYPQELACHNPECQDGGFDIGERITALLASKEYYEQNSLVCRNAIHPDRSRRCLHTIKYSISCIYPHGREEPRHTVRNVNVG